MYEITSNDHVVKFDLYCVLVKLEVAEWIGAIDLRPMDMIFNDIGMFNE